MATKISRVFWDSCVIIDAIQATPGRWERIEPFAREAEAGRLQIVISEVNVAEVLRLRGLDGSGVSVERQVELISNWLKNPYVVARSVNRGQAEYAAEIGRKYGVKGAADCIVVATALMEGIKELHTFDGETQNPCNGKTGGRKLLDFNGKIPNLNITAPDFSAGTLFDGNASA